MFFMIPSTFVDTGRDTVAPLTLSAQNRTISTAARDVDMVHSTKRSSPEDRRQGPSLITKVAKAESKGQVSNGSGQDVQPVDQRQGFPDARFEIAPREEFKPHLHGSPQFVTCHCTAGDAKSRT